MWLREPSPFVSMAAVPRYKRQVVMAVAGIVSHQSTGKG